MKNVQMMTSEVILEVLQRTPISFLLVRKVDEVQALAAGDAELVLRKHYKMRLIRQT